MWGKAKKLLFSSFLTPGKKYSLEDFVLTSFFVVLLFENHLRGYNSMVEYQPSKLTIPVRARVPA